MNNARFFIGFTTLEELLDECRSKEIYIAATTKSQTVQHGITMTDWIIRLSYIEGEKCFYWQKTTGVSNSFLGNAMGGEQENCRTRTFSLLDLLTKELKSREFKVNEAMVSFPDNLSVLGGQTALFYCNGETDKYERLMKYSVDSSSESFTLKEIIAENKDEPLTSEEIEGLKNLEIGQSLHFGLGAEVKRTF